MIPKVIHYCWFGGKPLPQEVKKCIKSWKRYAPDFEIIQWNESNFDVNLHPFVKSAFECSAWAFVSDYARLKIVYDYGGIYLDTDVELLKSIDDLLENKFFIGTQQGGYPTTGLGFGAEKGNRTVSDMLKEYDSLIYVDSVKKKVTCPLLNSKVIYELGYSYTDSIWKKNDVTVYPNRYFDPIAQGDTQCLLCEETYSIHHYAGSWTPWSQRMRRRIIRLIGEERIHKIKVLLGKAK